MHKKTVVIAGPTASGKTNLACKIAHFLQSGVISADSRQVYRGMDLGTGKDIEEYEINGSPIPYNCIDIANPEEIYTLYSYQRDCYAALNHYLSQDKTPVICGGTGLYIEAVLKKYRIANVPEDENFRIQKMEESKEDLIIELEKLSQTILQRTDLSSKKRVIRALEIALAEQKGPVEYGCDYAPELEPLILVTDWERDTLVDRIDQRLDERLSLGMINEVEKLFDQGISRERMDLFGMEYRQIGRFLFNEISFTQMRQDLAMEIHRLAKRQRTWFRGMEKRGLKTVWIKNANFEIALEKVEQFTK